MRSRSGYAELVTCGLVWGSIGVLVKKSPVSAPVIVFFRLALGALVVILWHGARGRLRELRLRGRRPLLLSSGFTLALHWVFFFLAFKRLSIATVILIVYVGPVFMALLAPHILGERLERRTVTSLILSLAGIALIAVPAAGGRSAIGLAAALIAMISFVALVFIGKRVVEEYQPAAIVAWQLGSAAVFVSPALIAARAHAIESSLPSLVALGVIHTGVCGLLYFRAMQVVKAQHMGILAYLEPVTAVLWAWVFIQEKPALLTLAGGVLIISAGLNIVITSRRAIASVEVPESQVEIQS
ncbi:MAG: DMT family transporter [Actinomycetota bacterium]|nr:DMT family transporter [Actinomycetota bacterium]